jgi:hypothetical protein
MKRAIHETVQNIVDRLPDDLIEAWQERAAVREYEAGFSRPHAEALACLDLLEDDPDVFTDLRVGQIDVDSTSRFFVASSENLLREHADLLGGSISARRSVAWCLDSEFGGLAELVAG